MKVFYDGYCPLCSLEMRHLKKHDKANELELIDIQQNGFSQRYPELDWEALNARIHAQKPDGRLVTGLDATHAMWDVVGKGWLYAPLRWPGIRFFADLAYRGFARHRYTISFFLTGKRNPCSKGVCTPKTTHNAGENHDRR